MKPSQSSGTMMSGKTRERVSSSFVYSVLFFAAPFRDLPRQKFFLFSSLAAIYEVFSPEQIGCGLRNLYNLRIPEGTAYAGGRCIIKREKVFAKRQRAR